MISSKLSTELSNELSTKLSTKRLASLFAVAALSSTMFAGSAQAAGGPTGTAADFGSPASSSVAPDRRIVIAAGAKAVNVTDGETVKFIKDGKSFNWHFSTFSGETMLDLAKIAPSGFDASAIKVYVDTDPVYEN